MSMKIKLLIGFVLLIMILLIERFTYIDLEIQNKIYDFTYHDWFIDEYLHDKLGIIFYDGIKYFDMLLAIILLGIILLSFKFDSLEKIRKPALILLLSLIFVPLIISSMKQITNVYCPKDLAIYGGDKPFIRILEASPKGMKIGKCFPAGHATSGFALMALFFCFEDKKSRLSGLAVGVSLGWITGMYQMLRGQHFFSHTIFTMIAAFMIISAIEFLLNRWYKEKVA